MIVLCPFCGYSLSEKLNDGISTCENCNRVFDSSDRNRILAASWAARRWHLNDAQVLESKFNLTRDECCLINQYVIQLLYSHDEFSKMLEVSLGVENAY